MLELNIFGDGARLHHLGVVTPNIATAYPDAQAIHDPIQNVFVAFLSVNGTCLELVQPCDETSPVFSSLKKGQKLLHLCYEVPNIFRSIDSAKQNRFACLKQPVPAVAFGGRKIAWLFHPTFGLVELLESEQHP